MTRDIEEVWGQGLCRVNAVSVLQNLLTAMQPKPVHTNWPGSQVLVPGEYGLRSVDVIFGLQGIQSGQADVIREGPGNLKPLAWSWALHAFKKIVHCLREKLQFGWKSHHHINLYCLCSLCSVWHLFDKQRLLCFQEIVPVTCYFLPSEGKGLWMLLNQAEKCESVM